MKQAKKGRNWELEELAWKLHREHGHADDYEGPCWGPTFAEREEAKRILAAQSDGSVSGG
jgi:hypothetical protein